MKIFILFLFLCSSLISLAQTPYDSFAPEQSVKRLIRLPNTSFKVVNPETDDSIRCIDFDKNTLSLILSDEKGTEIKKVVLSTKDVKFVTMDPLAEKYYSISPYAYCAGNPVNAIDINGDSITILNLGAKQHMAMLIQNDVGKWQYFSVNGDNVYFSGRHKGGREFDDLNVGEWNTPQEFLDSEYNSIGDKNDKNSSKYEFTEAYVIPTTGEQDQIIRSAFMNISKNESYDILKNNCSTAVQRSMEAAGLITYNKETYNYRVPANRSLGESSFHIQYSSPRPILPSTSFKSIIRINPQGQIISKSRR